MNVQNVFRIHHHVFLRLNSWQYEAGSIQSIPAGRVQTKDTFAASYHQITH